MGPGGGEENELKKPMKNISRSLLSFPARYIGPKDPPGQVSYLFSSPLCFFASPKEFQKREAAKRGEKETRKLTGGPSGGYKNWKQKEKGTK